MTTAVIDVVLCAWGMSGICIQLHIICDVTFLFNVYELFSFLSCLLHFNVF